MPKQKKIDQGVWEKKYKPLKDKYGSNIDADPRMGDVSKEDFNKAYKERRIWTLMDDNDGSDCYIVSGFHFVNRLAHYITEVPFKEGEDILVD